MFNRLVRPCVAVAALFMLAPGTAAAFESVLTQKVASWKVFTSQVATAAKAQINARTSVLQGEMAARGSLATSIEQLELYQHYSALTGQGAQVCDAVSQRNDIDSIGRSRDSFEFVAMPRAGRAAIASADYEVERGKAQLDAYCSADEHNLGVCKSRFDGMASASANFNKIMTADQFTSKQLRSAEDYIANLVPPPVPVRAAAQCDVGCQSARMAALRLDAVSSMVAAPMAMQMSGRIGAKTFAAVKK